MYFEPPALLITGEGRMFALAIGAISKPQNFSLTSEEQNKNMSGDKISTGCPRVIPKLFHKYLSQRRICSLLIVKRGESLNKWMAWIISIKMNIKPDNAQLPLALLAEEDEYVCWSRMQAEAGQPLQAIVARKEIERRAGSGLFFWGVGNAPATITRTLAGQQIPVRVVFSTMKSRPRLADSAPSRIVVWRKYIDHDGKEREVPPHVLVTSRAESARGEKKVHYALMCYSSEPLMLKSGIAFDHSAFRNAGGKGAPVGASQVTALLRRVEHDRPEADYEANFSAWLAGAYWVRLLDPVAITSKTRPLLARLDGAKISEWCKIVAAIRQSSDANAAAEENEDLFL